ncbi:resistance-nodulation-cell division acriflavin:proton (H+) antiporter [Planococcus antarcticus DSM 14505]|uniref:Multidrug transporter n=1 Tax=Planococcus antarcticus DSM 14505 TaxID=1185653 RepID=A0A1C7DES2_9BACL|nr:efflux RND transporter permease subunit [Planococcus antarcticus]ANU09723.1 multidrug transporter [Planococcus antarcticus DSM 14505]EIM05561.1 resistance-nodulation-cell division acriflavin:proton (H+) antiporter [Planococcus antarcticus DSM 14505]
MKYILDRGKLFIFLILILSIVGAYVFITLPQREIPETPSSLVLISTILPGAGPEEVETSITNPLESEIQKVDGIASLQSVSANSASIITLEIEDGENPDELINSIQQQAGNATSGFPDNASETTVEKLDLTFPLVSYMFYGDKEELANMEDALSTLSEEVEAVSGVAGTTVKGLNSQQVLIELNSEELAANQLQPFEVLQSLQQANQPLSLGTHDNGNEQVSLTVQQGQGIEKLKELQVGAAAVPLADVATIETVDQETEDIVTFEGEDAISYTVFLQTGQDVPAVDDNVSEIIEEFAGDLPAGVQAEKYESQADNVNEIFDGLYVSLAIAVLAVLIVTTAGLTLYGSFAVALTVLVSVLIGMIPIPWLGVDLNQISVIGLIIAIGILVDDSIVVNDNIQRRYKLGDSALDGAITGVREVYPSIISSSLAIVVTFSPLLLLSGGNGAFIKALPSILITTILASTVLSITLVPMMQYLKTKRRAKKISDTPGFLGKPLEKIALFYSNKVLRGVLKRPLLVGVGGLLVATGLLSLALFTPFEFFPAADREEVTMNVRLAEGTTIENTDEFLASLTEEVESEDDNIAEISIFSGEGLPNLFASSMNNTGGNTGQVVFRIDRDQTTAADFIDKWQPELRERFPEAEIFLDTIVQGPPVGAPVTVDITGEDIEELASLRDQLKEQMLAEGATIVTDNLGDPVPAIEYVPNQDALQENKIALSSVTNQLQLLTQGVPLYTIYESQMPYQVFLKQSGIDEGQPIDLSQFEVPALSQQGPPTLVPMDELLTPEDTTKLSQVPHKEAERSITLRAFGDVADFENKMLAVVDTERESLPEGYELSTGGENSDQEAFFAEISILFLVVILLVYLVIAFQFKSFSLPFLVLIAVYLGVSGAILGLFLTQTPLSFLGVMGIVSLTGIVVRNAVVLIDFVETRRLSGNFDIKEAIIESGYARIKPILLTTITSIIALVPIALSGDPLFEPLAVTIIAGLAFSSLFTLVMIPALYLVFYRVNRRRNKIAE